MQLNVVASLEINSFNFIHFVTLNAIRVCCFFEVQDIWAWPVLRKITRHVQK